MSGEFKCFSAGLAHQGDLLCLLSLQLCTPIFICLSPSPWWAVIRKCMLFVCRARVSDCYFLHVTWTQTILHMYLYIYRNLYDRIQVQTSSWLENKGFTNLNGKTKIVSFFHLLLGLLVFVFSSAVLVWGQLHDQHRWRSCFFSHLSVCLASLPSGGAPPMPAS